MPESLSQRIYFNLGCNAQYDKVESELIPDADMYLLFEKGMRR